MDKLELYHEWADAMRADFEAAQSTILLSALSLHWSALPAATPHGDWCRALAAAARRGVGVMMVLPVPTRAHPATAQNHTHAARAAVHGIRTRWVGDGRLLHAKSAVIDTSVIWIGSGNLTNAAMSRNHETYLRAVSPPLAVRHAAHLLKISDSGI